MYIQYMLIYQCDLSCVVDPLLAVPGLIRHLGSRVFRSGPALRDLVQEICGQDKDQAPKNSMDDLDEAWWNVKSFAEC